MRVIKQKDQDYASFQLRLEQVLEGIFYHPINRKNYQKRYKSGKYTRDFRRLRGPVRKLTKNTLDGLKLHFCGVSHLDAAWLFPVVDTKVRAYKTFFKAVEHCDEFPFLTFSQTTPQYFQWIKAYDKKLWEKVKEKVAEGRIELTGGMWVEPSLDMPCGEALVRQRLYGQLFFLREFGHFPKMASLLDVFGFPWSTPQIMLKSGATSFWTTKDAGTIPFSSFYWQGIDGSRIFAFINAYNWDACMNAEGFKKRARFPAPEYNQKILNSHNTRQEVEACFSKDPNDFNPNFPVFYGLGDGGRGPLELECMFADALSKLHNGKHTSQHDFIELMRKTTGDRYLIWNDEKFLTYHRGVKTTQLEVKHYNRMGEMFAMAAESMLTWFKTLNPDIELNIRIKSYIFEMWRKILFNQFHDILPGSSIPDVYILAVKEQKNAIAMAEYLLSLIFEYICSSEEKKKDEILMFNPLSWSHSRYIYFQNTWYYLEKMPALSISQYNPSDSTLIAKEEEFNTIRKEHNQFIIENNILAAKIDINSGSIVSLVNKELGKELIDPCKSANNQGSGFRVYWEDPERWKAWNLDKRYPIQKIQTFISHPPSLSTDERGIQILTTKIKFLNSTATVSFWLRPKDDMLRMDIHTDVKDPEILVKYFIPLAIKSEDVVSDIPYGTISRRRVKRTKWEWDKWEMNMQKWLDLSDQDGGLAIVNNNRYGFSATKNGIYLTLTRTPKYPGVSPLYGSTRIIRRKDRPKHTDLMPFTYMFGVYPHKNDWKKSKVWEKAFEFNLPLISNIYNRYNIPKSERPKDKKINLKINQEPLIHISLSNIRIGAFKLPEWNGEQLDKLVENKNWSWNKRSAIIRLVEMEGIDCKVNIKFLSQIKIKKVEEVDLLEMNPKIVDFNEHSNDFSLNMGHYEIKTLKIWF